MDKPNHLLYQWKDEFYKLYPDANILVADKNDFTEANRERLFGRIATGDWDAVIVAHSSFRKIDMPRDVQDATMPCLPEQGKKTGPWTLLIWAWTPCLSTKAMSLRIWPSKRP